MRREKDPFDLPSTPEGSGNKPPIAEDCGTYRTPHPVSFFVTVSDIKKFISPKLYSELSWDENRSDEDVTKDCIDKAVTIAEVLFEMVDQKLNLFSKTQIEVVKLLTVSKLYEYNGDKNGTKEFLQRAEKLISDRYRSIDKERESEVPFIALSKKRKIKCR